MTVVEADDPGRADHGGAAGDPVVGLVARVEIAQRAHETVAGAAVAEADGEFIDRRGTRQTEGRRLGVDFREAQAVFLRMQIQPGRGDDHRHVVLGFGRELLVDRGVPEAAAAGGAIHAQRAAFAAVVGGQPELDVVAEFGVALAEVRGGGAGGHARVVAGIETGAVRPQAEPATGRRHELQRPDRTGARTHVDAAGGFLGHDPEQQRLGQAAALEGRRHLVAHVLIVLMRLDQRHAHVGEPAADAGLHRRVHPHHVDEALAVGAEQRCGLGGHRNVGGGDLGIDQALHIFADGRVAGSAPVDIGLEQALVGGEQIRDRATLELEAGGDRVLHVLQRGVAFERAGGVAVADLHQRVAIAAFGGGHPHLHRIQIAGLARLRLEIVGRQGRQRQQHEQRQRTQAGKRAGDSGEWGHEQHGQRRGEAG